MLSNAGCLDADLLERLQHGRIPPAVVETLSEHLAECRRCAEAAGSLSPDDPLTTAAQAGACAGDETDRSRIEGLIGRLRQLAPPPPEGSDADQPTFDFLAPARHPDEIGRLGPYRVLGVLGAGGMGVVFRAEDEQLRRPVALKVLRMALAADPAARQRFLREARTAAALAHEHVVTVFQVGEDRGVPFLAMPLLKGESLEDRLRREGALPLAEVLRIGREIAAGLAAAHEGGLIHRDIKPANVWLEASPGHEPGEGRVKLLDFGLARRVADDARLTQEGTVAGTPLYMAPEQAEGKLIDHRSDLFSLGCVLYRMAAGRPFSRAERPTTPRRHRPDLPRPVNDLILRLLALAPADRPTSARAVAESLAVLERRSFGNGIHPFLLAASVLTVAALGTAVAFVIPWPRELPATSRLEEPKPAGLVQFFRGHQGAVHSVAFFPDSLQALSGGEDGTVRVWNGVTAAGDLRLPGHKVGVKCMAVSSNGRLVLSGSHDGTVVLGDAHGGRELQRIVLPGPVSGLAFAPDNDRALIATYLGYVALWDLVARKAVWHRNFAHKRAGVCFSPDGRQVFSAGFSGWVSALDAADGREVQTFPGHAKGTYGVTATPDGRFVLTSGFDGEVRLSDAATGQEVRRYRGHTGEVRGLAVSADGRRVLTGALDKTVRLWDLDTGQELATFKGHASYVLSVALSPDGRFAVSGGYDSLVGLWRLPPE